MPSEKKYAIAIMATRKNEFGLGTNLAVAVLWAKTSKEAHAKALLACIEYYPSSKGYGNHSTSFPVEV